VLGWLERRGLMSSLQASGAPGQASYW
jgi:hypothetical protein